MHQLRGSCLRDLIEPDAALYKSWKVAKTELSRKFFWRNVLSLFPSVRDCGRAQEYLHLTPLSYSMSNNTLLYILSLSLSLSLSLTLLHLYSILPWGPLAPSSM